MVKHIYPLLLFLSFTVNLLAQESSIATKFMDNGSIYKSLAKSSEAIAQFEENDKCIVLDYLGKYTYKVKYKNSVGYVKDEFLSVNEDMMDLFYDFQDKERLKATQAKENKKKALQDIIDKESIAKTKEVENIALIEKRKIDAIARAKEEENKKLEAALRRKNDSIVQLQIKEKALAKIKNDSAIEKDKETESFALIDKIIIYYIAIDKEKDQEKKKL